VRCLGAQEEMNDGGARSLQTIAHVLLISLSRTHRINWKRAR
jgi:hypothetical protein